MVQQFKIITVTHKTINLKRLGAFGIPNDPSAALPELRERFRLAELFYLATCNRVMYFFVHDEMLDASFAREFLLAANAVVGQWVEEEMIRPVQMLEGQEAIGHLFEVAASMDSLVIGERQILRQLRESYEQCRDWGLTGPWIQLAFQQAQLAAKSIYSNTRIGEKPVSVVSLAMQQLFRHKPEKNARILVVGAGQTNNLVAKFLLKHQFRNVTVFNRTLGRARQLADFLGGRALPLDDLQTYREGFDCLIVCTGSRQPIIHSELYARLLAGETDRKVVIDLSVPHNVDPEVVAHFPLHYIEIEGLRQVARENLSFREKEVQVARKQLDLLLGEFPQTLRQRQLELAMREVPDQIKSVRTKALNEVFRKEVEELDTSTQELINRMMEYMEKKCIGIPMRVARTAVLSKAGDR